MSRRTFGESLVPSISTQNSSMILNVGGRSTFVSSSNGTTAGGTTIAGTIGASVVIDRSVTEGKVDINTINGTWEAYVPMIVTGPVPGVAEATKLAEGAKRAKSYEGVLTRGMRGCGDTALASGIEKEVLQYVVAAPIEILTDLWGNESVTYPDIVAHCGAGTKKCQGTTKRA
ncbi:glycoside hydrolase family 115 protein [Dothistroma septosporum NZE10]|uniref:Glycoside hydrolase family 115 protein n=1 Tax=Dothistroma septosporum (strain NZE10 / CBS 128990) TaxID=675120 RepID=N1PTQ8_DOTSN|nr:glycoside hydrolase family 115 protein [Dothistroma septosporum NZE10]